MDAIGSGVGDDSSVRSVGTREDEKMNVEQGEESDDTSDEDVGGRGFAEPCAVKTTQQHVPIETDQDAKPSAGLRSEVVEEIDEFTRDDRVRVQVKAVDG